MEILTKDFVECIECCVANEVKCLIAGGCALAAQGHLDPLGKKPPTSLERAKRRLG